MTDLDDAIAKFPIVSYLRQFPGFEDRGREHVRLNCPVCRGYMKLNVHRELKRGHCFKCDEGGAGLGRWNGKANLFGLIRILENLDDRAAFKRIYAFAGLPDPIYVRPTDTQTVRGMPSDSIRMQNSSLHESAVYLRGRGVGHLLNTASVCVSGMYTGRVILPCNFLGKFEGFEAKSYCGHARKTLYPQWFETGRTIYTTPWYFGANFAVITESVLDAETLGVNAVGLYGSVLRDGQLSRLLDLRERGVRRLVWMLDADAIRKSAIAIRKKTFSWFENFVIQLNAGEDPNSIGRDECWRRVAEASLVRDEFDTMLAPA